MTSLLYRRGGSIITSGGEPGTSFGPGPNAPAWSGKTVYTDQRFLTPIPSSSQDAAGFQSFQGFATEVPYNGGTRVTYPTATTPFGDKPVLRLLYPGQSEVINGVGQTTTPWAYFNENAGYGYERAVIHIPASSSFAGTLAFESSVDGVTWEPITLTSLFISGGPVPNGTRATETTQANTTWSTNDFATGVRLLRARATSWTSGSATVRVGFRGGQSPARFTAGTFASNPTRIYLRNVWRRSSNWSDGGNSGTKQFFFMQADGNNHYVDGTRPEALGLQYTGGAPDTYRQGTTVPVANGEWMDCEYLIEGGTSGGSDAVFRCWVNGVLQNDLSGLPMFIAGRTPRFTNLFYDPTYGGGGNPPPSDQYYDIAYMYRESAP